MHILGILLAVVGVAGVVLWRLHTVAEATKGLVEAGNDVHGLFRRRRWQSKLLTDPLDEVDDARMAATVMMVVLAQNDGALTEREESTILNHLADHFGATRKIAADMLAHARWLLREPRELDNVFRKLSRVIRGQCGPEEIADLFDMLETVAAANGLPRKAEQLAIGRLRATL